MVGGGDDSRVRAFLSVVAALLGYAVLAVLAGLCINVATGRSGLSLVACLAFAVVLTAASYLFSLKVDPAAFREFRHRLWAAVRHGNWAPVRTTGLLPLVGWLLGVHLAGLAVFLTAIVALGDSETPCQGPRVTIRVASSQDKDGVLREIAKGYDGHRVGDTCGEVEIVSMNSGTVMRALARGWHESTDGQRPDVWSPASSIWLTLYGQQVSTSDKTDPVPDGRPPSIVTAPLTIAMPEPMARALGWPDRPIGWADLAELSTSKGGWAAKGHPEWGAFQLGKTNPKYSTSGLDATIGTYFAATGNTSDMTVAEVRKPKVQDFVRSVEQSIVHYGDISLTFLENLQRAGQRGEAMAYISAVTVEENSVIDYNRGNPSGDPATLGRQPVPTTRLVAIYPKEGTLYSDHPYVQLSWMNDAKRAVAADFLRYLRSPAVQAAFQSYGYRDYMGRPGPLANPANGVHPDMPITTLNPPSPEVINEVLASWSRLRKRANVLIVIDKSGSMEARVRGTGKSRLELAKAAALDALPQFRPDDRVGLWEFSSEQDGDHDYREVVPAGPMSAVGPRLRTEIGKIEPAGETGLYDTMAAAFDQMRRNREPDAINAVVFLTDGRNEKKKPGLDLPHLLPLLDKPRQESVRVFTIGYGEEADQQVLKQIADITEGHAYDSRDPTVIDNVFTSVISNF
jgi:Ca-activated chloride channel family protein